MSSWDQYEVVCKLGQGKYGTVTRARHKTLGSHVALKSVLSLEDLESSNDCSPLTTSEEKEHCFSSFASGAGEKGSRSKEHTCLFHEAQVLSTLSHHSLVSLVEICVGSNGNLVLALEDLGGTSLTSLVHRAAGVGLCEGLVGCIASHIASALCYLHSRGYLHRDVKPDNIMVENTDNCFPQAKLIDLGLSIAFCDTDLPNTSCSRAGTLAFMAPELMLPDTRYGPKVDMFSLGASLYYALVGEEPFVAFTSQAGVRSTSSVFGLQVQHENALNDLSSDVSTVIIQALSVCPDERCSVQQLLLSRWLRCNIVSSSFARGVRSAALPALHNWLQLHQELPLVPPLCASRGCVRLGSVSSTTSSNDCSSSNFENSDVSCLGSSNLAEQSLDNSSCSHLSKAFITESKSKAELCAAGKAEEMTVTSIVDASQGNTLGSKGSLVNKGTDNYTQEMRNLADISGTTSAIHKLSYISEICSSSSLGGTTSTSVITDDSIMFPSSSLHHPLHWDEATLSEAARVLCQDPSDVVQRITRRPWGRDAGVYNLLRMRRGPGFGAGLRGDGVGMQRDLQGRNRNAKTM